LTPNTWCTMSLLIYWLYSRRQTSRFLKSYNVAHLRSLDGVLPFMTASFACESIAVFLLLWRFA